MSEPIQNEQKAPAKFSKLDVYMCKSNNAMVCSGGRQAVESDKEETTAGVQQSGFVFIRKTIFQHTQNAHSHAEITVQRGPQGKHSPYMHCFRTKALSVPVPGLLSVQ